MALFGSKKKTEKNVASSAKAEKAVAVRESASTTPARGVILRPRITEKSGMAGEAHNVYTFEVAKNATKHAIARDIKSTYKVTPVKVRTISLPGKTVFVRGRWGTKSAVKKALVYLKKGDKIEIV
jgi:large subunit ribosomal protein L23